MSWKKASPSSKCILRRCGCVVEAVVFVHMSSYSAALICPVRVTRYPKRRCMQAFSWPSSAGTCSWRMLWQRGVCAPSPRRPQGPRLRPRTAQRIYIMIVHKVPLCHADRAPGPSRLRVSSPKHTKPLLLASQSITRRCDGEATMFGLRMNRALKHSTPRCRSI